MMKIYTQYISNFSNSLECLRELDQEVTFREWRQGVEYELHGKRLPSYLIMPIQRIPRYLLLLAVIIIQIQYIKYVVNIKIKKKIGFIKTHMENSS